MTSTADELRAGQPPLGQMAAFLTIASALWLGLHGYVAWRFADGLGIASSAGLWGATGLVGLSCVLALVVARARPCAWAEHVRYVAYLYMGAFSVACAAAFVTHVLAGLWTLFAPMADRSFKQGCGSTCSVWSSGSGRARRQSPT